MGANDNLSRSLYKNDMQDVRLGKKMHSGRNVKDYTKQKQRDLKQKEIEND